MSPFVILDHPVLVLAIYQEDWRKTASLGGKDSKAGIQVGVCEDPYVNVLNFFATLLLIFFKHFSCYIYRVR
jgi:hypothetical protein